MVFVLAQSLDNRSPDLCVWHGQLMHADAPQARAAQDTMWAIQRGATPVELRHTVFYAVSGERGDALPIVIKVGSPDVDASGRRSPLLLLTDESEVTRPDFGAAVKEAAGQLSRQILLAQIMIDVEAWRALPGSGRHGRLRKVKGCLRAGLGLSRGLGAAAAAPEEERPPPSGGHRIRRHDA